MEQKFHKVHEFEILHSVFHKIHRPKVTNLSSVHCVLNYFFAHYFVLLVDT